MVKILAVALFNDPTGQGGVESFNRTLKNFYPKNLKFIVFNLKKEIESLYEVDDVIKIGALNLVFRIINKILRNGLRNFLLKRKVQKIRPDFLIFSSPYEINVLHKVKAKKIFVQHTSLEEYKRSYLYNKENEKILKEIPDYFIFLSSYDKENFCKKLNLDERKARVIRHSSGMKLLQAKKEKNKKLIMVARIDNNSKRFDLAINAMKRLPDYTLDIYGNGPDIEYCQKIIKEEKINNVFFRGSTNRVQEKLDKSGIFIMTSDYEGYGIVNIEAMRRGLPIVLRNTFEAAQDIVIDNGILLDREWDEDKFVEAVKKIYDNYEYYSENSKKLGERHSSEVIKEEWDSLLKGE